MSPDSVGTYVNILEAESVPRYVVVASLIWILYDYFLTLGDEVGLVWPQRWNRGKMMFLFVRYYTIALLILNTIELHTQVSPFATSPEGCIVSYISLRVLCAIALWVVEIVIQIRIYALFGCSRKIAIINAILFVSSIISFLGITVYSGLSMTRDILTTPADIFTLGCPLFDGGIQWAEWIPATIYEAVLFGYALYEYLQWFPKTVRGMSTYRAVVHDNMFYFLGITFVLLLNDLSMIGVDKIPWFSYGPFCALLGIMTSRMILNLLRNLGTPEELDIMIQTIQV